jgi:hypothetical protein
LSLAGEAGKAIGFGCLQILLLVFHMVAIGVVSALDAHFLFNLSVLWSLGAATLRQADTEP